MCKFLFDQLLCQYQLPISRTWKLSDLCYKPALPQTEIPQIVEPILDNLFPCAIITPLDCFWEGSKILGPDHPVRIP